MRIVYVIALLSFLHATLSISSDNDFYNLLGIERSSDTRTIRKAFKKLALTLHPDKNPDNDQAHEKFLAINRAYEVLKDDDLRRIYDEFGESGLKQHETGRGNYQRYQSWNYYNEFFGIYDNDNDIITLSRSDFEQSVRGQRHDTIWFINFYSPRCSHCHTLAPEWRKLAKALRNVIRIGAVNCAEDRELCQNEGIRSYPSLVLYPQIKKHSSGESRNSKDLLKFVMKNLNVKIKRYNDVNMKYLINELSSQYEMKDNEEKKNLKQRRTSWYVLVVCYKEKQCFSETEMELLTYKLNGIAQVAEILCNSKSNEICKHFRLHENKIVLYEDLIKNPQTYYEISNIKFDENNEIDIEKVSTKVEDILKKIIKKFPNIKTISELDKIFLEDCLFGNKTSNCKDRLDSGWILIMFQNEKQANIYEIEMKLLAYFIPQHPIFYIICENNENSKIFCSKFDESNNIKQYPKLITLKYVSIGSYEKYYGRFNAIDILNFALDSFESKLRILNAKEFEETIVKDKVNAHLVQFFSPLCPACKVAQQKLRKLSQYSFSKPVTFGVIDCGVFSSLCRRYNIQSYPTVLLYNNTVPHQYVGKFNEDKPIIDFIHYILESNLIEIDPEFFRKEIHSLSQDKPSKRPIWIVSFSSPFCYICQVLSPTLRKLSSILTRDEPNAIKIGSLNCNRFRSFCMEEDIQSYPTIRLYPSGSDLKHKAVSYTFKNRRDFHMLRSWIYDFLPSSLVEEIEDVSDFENVISNNHSKIIDFYSPWAFSSRRFQPEFIRLSRIIPAIKFQRLNCERMARLCDDLNIHFYPSLRFYSGSENGKQYKTGIHIHLPDMDNVDELDLTDISEGILSLLAETVSTKPSIKSEL